MMMALWRDAPDTQKMIERAEKTRTDLEAFIKDLDAFVSMLNQEIDEQEGEEQDA